LAEAPKGLAVVDELTTVSPAMQAGMLRFVNERAAGDFQLPDTVSIIAAANPPEQAANGTPLAAPLANRFCWIYWRMSPQDWADGVIAGWPDPVPIRLPENWRDRIPSVYSLIASFIAHKPNDYQVLPKDDHSASGPWPSGRSWLMAGRLLAAAEAIGAPESVKALAVSGCVGEGVALEFMTWQRELDLPDPEALLKKPDTLVLPERGDRAFAVLSSVVSVVLANNTPARWRNAWMVLAKAADTKPDIAASAARALAKNRPVGGTVPTDIKAFVPLLKRAGIM
jgi:hypothetical protein